MIVLLPQAATDDPWPTVVLGAPCARTATSGRCGDWCKDCAAEDPHGFAQAVACAVAEALVG